MTVRVTALLDDETDRLLARLAQQEFRSKSGTLGLLIRQEAAARGMLGRAPTMIAQSELLRRQASQGATKEVAP